MIFRFSIPGPSAWRWVSKRNMNYRIFIIVIVVFSFLVGCGVKSVRTLGPNIVGEWETDIYVSQLGNTISYLQFKENGTFKTILQLLHINQTYTSEGTFICEGDEIFFTTKDKSSKEKSCSG
jgi:hypothetical protein